jgi:hypothetical protein
MLGRYVQNTAEKSPDRRRRRLLVEAPGGSSLPGLAVLTALMLMCSVLVAKTLAFMVENLEIGPGVELAQVSPQPAPATPVHRRALSDKFLRKGVDDLATGSIRPEPNRR